MKFCNQKIRPIDKSVAPYAGAWIEIYERVDQVGRGDVAPYAGAWIEMADGNVEIEVVLVAPYAGAWIEIQSEADLGFCNMSHPTRVRGLKSL